VVGIRVAHKLTAADAILSGTESWPFRFGCPHGIVQFSRRDETVGESKRLACLDGDEYFGAFRAVAIRAQQSIMILRWDFDSRTGRVMDQKLEWLITDSRP
jgi:hypothetical protein